MANGHGGRRPGSGRKPGAATRVSREVADRLAGEGLSPLELIVGMMRKYHAEGKFALALDAAVKAAPYLHPRLAAVEVSGGETPVRLLVIEEIVGDGSDGPANGEAAPHTTGLPGQ